MKKENIIWGMAFILVALCLIIGKLGVFNGFNIWNIALTVIFVVILVKSLFKLNYYGIFFPIAFLAIIYDKQLGIEVLTPWTVLIAAALISVGLSLIFPIKKKSQKQFDKACYYSHPDEQFDRIVKDDGKNHIKSDVHFSSEIRYINTDSFESADINCKFGAAKIYFDNATLKGDHASINLDVSFAGLELFIPHTWRLVNRTSIFLGAIEKKGICSEDEEAPEVLLCGDISFAGITIHYV